MHLSMLSDCYLSDALDDAADFDETGVLAHRKGLLRGLAVLGIASLLIGLTLLSSSFHAAEADTRHCSRVDRHLAQRPQAAIWWESNDILARSTHAAIRRADAVGQTGTSVSLVALRQRFRSDCR